MEAHSALSGLPRCIVMLSGGATLTRPTIQAVLRAMRQVAPVSAAPPGMITAPISRMTAHSALSGLPRCIVMLSGGATLTRPTIQAAPRAMRQVAPVSAAPPGMNTAPLSRMTAHSALSGLPRCIVMLSGGATLTRPTIQAAPCHETGSPGKRSATGDDHSALSGLPRCIVMFSGGATLTRPTIQAVLRAMRQVAPVSAAPPGMITAPISRMAAHSALSGLLFGGVM